MAHRDDVVALFSQALRSQPIQRGGVAVWYDVPALLTTVSASSRAP
jgi:hypothetical protein